MKVTDRRIRRCFGMVCRVLAASFLALAFYGVIHASAGAEKTEDSQRIYAVGSYSNWDGVTNVAQFRGPQGDLYYAVDSDTAVIVHKTSNGKPVSGTVTLTKQHPLFGTVICDDDGNYYLVTGEANETDDVSVNTVFISKYNSSGNHIKTVGDNGDAGYGDSFCTKVPFDGGNCDAAIHDGILSVLYAREMYSGHQSCGLFSVAISDLSKVNLGAFYESHSFAQRVVPTAEGFVFMSEGDCYDRAFVTRRIKVSNGSLTYSREESIFDFWVRDGALEAYNMYVLNDNFAHMGGMAVLSDGNIAFTASSVKSLNGNAEKESEEIFLQIFNPYVPLNDPSAYVTVGERSGLAGPNGRTEVTNYGVKWLTSYGTSYTVFNVQIVASGAGKIIVLYELSGSSGYQGVYYIVLNEKGTVTTPATCFDPKARLNPCEMPVFKDNRVYWVGNRYGDSGYGIYIYTLDLRLSKITEQPQDITVPVGNKAGFSVSATGAEPLTYQWQYRKNSTDTWKTSGQSGNKTATLSVATTAGLHGYQFRCVVTDGNNRQIYSETATLKLRPKFTALPADTTAAVGRNAVFTVEATGKGPLTYQWQYRRNSSDTWKTSGQSGNKTATLSVAATAGLHGYQFRCCVTDANGQRSYTNTVTLSVRPGITTWPKDTTAAPGTTAKFTIAATGKGTLTYQWQYRKNSTDTWKASGQSGNKTATLSVAVTAGLQGYQFRCYVTDANGQRSYTNTVTLTVSPRITTQPVSKSVTAGSTAKFTVEAAGTGTLTYQWQYRKNSSSTWTNSGQSGNKTGTLSVATKKSLNGYQFRCIVTDGDGRQSISNTVALTVK